MPFVNSAEVTKMRKSFREPSETDAEDTGESDAAGEDEHVDGSTDSEGVQPEPV